MANFVRRINVPETLRSLEVGEQIVFPFRKITPSAVRSAATKMRAKGYDFDLKQSSKECKTIVTRTK